MRRLLLTIAALAALVQTGSMAGTPLVNHGDTWRYHKGTNAPQASWQTITDASLDATWATGAGGFGYGDPGILGEMTTLGDMQNLYTTFNVRHSFAVNSVIDTNLHFQLTIDYDDGFVAYLDGAELTRANAPGVSGTAIANTALASGLHEASCCNAPVNPPSVIDLGPVGNRLGLGTHVLAFIGLNASAASTDAHLIADLALTTNAAPPPGNLSLVLTTNVAPGGYVEVDGVDAAAFDPGLWQAGHLNLLPDHRSPFLSPLSGTWRNIYAPSSVETPAGYRLFYGGWDGVATGNDRIYSLDADFQFQNFANRHWVVVPGTYIHVNNVNALRFDDGSFVMNATLYPVTNLNKPVFLKSDTTGTNWSGGVGEPYTINASNLVNITGYNYAPADINGMNVMLHEDGVYRLYFGDFQNFNGVFRATSTDGKNYAYETKALNGVYAVNDVKKFLVGGTNYYLMGFHRNTDRLWYSVSTNALGFTSVPTLLTNAAAADLYIVALGWVVRGPQESPGRKLLGVLYGAGAVSTLDKNFIFARWLQKRVAFVSTDGTRSEGAQSLGPQRQLIAFSQGNPVAGHFEVYAEDGITLLGTSPTLLLQTGQTYQLQFSPSPIPIGIQRSGNDKVILNWTNPVFHLQSSLVVTGAFAVISNSASPFTNAVTGAAKYFRLQAP
jgi:hypothetical protein